MITEKIFELLGNLGFFGLAMWFIQMLLSKSADRKFEKYKTELDQKTKEFQFNLDSKLETYKIELNLQNYKATKIYEQQLTIILDIHKKLSILNRKMAIMPVVLMKNITERTEETEKKEIDAVSEAIIAYDDLHLFYQDNLIFIPQNIVEKINSILGDYSQNFVSYVSQKGTNNEITFEQAFASAKRMPSEIKQALDLLTFEFKSLFGVEKQVKTT
jgi:hypothetical protein